MRSIIWDLVDPKPTDRLVFLYLELKAGRRGECVASIAEISAAVNCIPRTTMKAIKALESWGLIERERRRRLSDGGQDANLYRIAKVKRQAA